MLASSTAAIPTAEPSSIHPLLASNSIIAPTTIMPEIAFVSDIKGECRAGVTFQITINPINTDKMNTRNRFMKFVYVANESPIRIPARQIAAKIHT